VELILLLSFLVSVFIFFGYLLYRYRKSLRARTTLLLELGADNERFTRVIGTLSLSPSFYSFQVNRQATEIRLLEDFLSMQLHWAGLSVEDTTLNSPAEVATFIKKYTRGK